MLSRIIKDKLSRSPKSVLLLGPRQVGKSTVCGELNPNTSINLADEREYRLHLQDAALISRIVDATPKNSLILVDEIQRIPAILNTLQSLIDKEPNRKFLITGSSARKLKRGDANLLPGRVFVERMSPLLFWELGEGIDLERILRIGALPEIYLKEYGEKLLDSYVNTYLREEIQAEAVTKDLGAYSRFLDLAAELSGQHLNYSKIASDAEIKKETVRRYFSILEDTLLVERIPSYTDLKQKRQARQKDRFVFFDIGVRNAILHKHTGNQTKTERGHLFEQWFFLQILNYIRLYDKAWKLYSFATVEGTEVDLVIDTGKEIILVEVKYRDRVDDKMARGLLAFEQLTGRKTKKFIAYTGKHRQAFPKGIEAIPYNAFLGELIPSL